jgi:membrane protease YdiL (CAAX protease family)
LIGVIFTVIAAPVIEEVTYRYYLYKGIEKRSVVLAFVVTVFLFAAMHLIPSLASGTLIEDLRSLPAYLLASFLFTFAYYRSKKIMVPIIAHMIYNGFAVLMLLVAF